MFGTFDVGIFSIGMGAVVGVCFGFGLDWVGMVFGVVVSGFGGNKVMLDAGMGGGVGVYANDVGKMIGAGDVGGVGTSLGVGIGGVVGVGASLGVCVVVGGDVEVGLSTLIAIKICSCFFIMDSMIFTIFFKSEIDFS
ncbi:hypothetical protein QVD17_33255 [Tagetes erecta]|uniref:Uncharacterized protein n=1 Tax=Tagetes erecta TaxID=13708 RepID=A0AAD8JYM0_TARER|nr:hypothetical protein QVD17_33255 [Tagetes erecta]